ncbi:MAG: hypothetical protein HC876_20755 [Chloroflexaceae bacterium]|nr:hypothetical protein [Chloroflexaceae bacterium]
MPVPHHPPAALAEWWGYSADTVLEPDTLIRQRPTPRIHALTYKQQRQVLNALWRMLRNPAQLLAFLMVVGYGAISILMIAFLLIVPIPADFRDLLALLGLQEDILAQLQNLRGRSP